MGERREGKRGQKSSSDRRNDKRWKIFMIHRKPYFLDPRWITGMKKTGDYGKKKIKQ